MKYKTENKIFNTRKEVRAYLKKQGMGNKIKQNYECIPETHNDKYSIKARVFIGTN